jgi:acetyltransferase-like isoleucine patch superfamily enzyme
MNNNLFSEFEQVRSTVPGWARELLPSFLKRWLSALFWTCNDVTDFVAESIGWLPSHTVRSFLYRHLLGVKVGVHTSVHRHCRFYYPGGIVIGDHTVINRDVLLDGRMGLFIGSNVSVSEGVAIFTLEHDPDSVTFQERGATVYVEDYVFVGARATILPGLTIGRGSAVAAGAVVTHDVAPYTVVAGVPARPIGMRRKDLSYRLDYHKFLG